MPTNRESVLTLSCHDTKGIVYAVSALIYQPGCNILETFIEWCLASPPGADVDRVKLTGEPEREHKRRRAAEGIAVDATTWEEILVSADKLKLARAEVKDLAGV